MTALLLVRYGELTLKSPPVRREFERALRRNVLEQFVAAGLTCRLRTDFGHLYVEAESAPQALPILRRVFGVTSASEVVEVPTDRAAITAATLALAEPVLHTGSRFAIRARRTGQHPFTSQELAAELGGDVLERLASFELVVDLEHPDVEIAVEVRDARTYLSIGRSPGPGGLPLGVAGHIVALVDGRRAALGAYLMMKRGCRCALVPTAAGRPFVDGVLRRFDPHARVSETAESFPLAESAVQTLAEATRADGIVLPLDIDGYAAQRERWGDRVLFSPTVGLTDEEVELRWHAVEALAG